jgi:hypothetical protein
MDGSYVSNFNRRIIMIVLKEDLKDGVYYIGIRGKTSLVMMWDSSSSRFKHFRYAFKWIVEDVHYWADKANGFIPVEEVKILNKYEIKEIREKEL